MGAMGRDETEAVKIITEMYVKIQTATNRNIETEVVCVRSKKSCWFAS